MFNTLSLEELKQTSSVAGAYRLGDVTTVFDSTYGPLKAVWCYNQSVITTANCSPVFEDIAAGHWYADQAYNESGVIGVLFVVGAFLAATATTAASYGWVLVAGLNPLAMYTDGNVAAGGGVRATTTGTWGTVAATQNVATTGTAYNTIGAVPGIALAADASTAQAVGTVMFHSIWAGLPRTV
jgi:hypothetical protein